MMIYDLGSFNSSMCGLSTMNSQPSSLINDHPESFFRDGCSLGKVFQVEIGSALVESMGSW